MFSCSTPRIEKRTLASQVNCHDKLTVFPRNMADLDRTDQTMGLEPSQRDLNKVSGANKIINEIAWKKRSAIIANDQAQVELYDKKILEKSNSIIPEIAKILELKGVSSRTITKSNDKGQEFLEVVIDPSRNSSNEIVTALKRVKKTGGKSFNQLIISPYSTTGKLYAGSYSGGTNNIKLDIRNFEELFIKTGNELSQTIRHELRHMYHDARRARGEKSIYDISFFKSDQKSLPDLDGGYLNYMSSEELYTFASDLTASARELKKGNVKNVKAALKNIKNEADRFINRTKTAEVMTRSNIDELDKYLDKIEDVALDTDLVSLMSKENIQFFKYTVEITDEFGRKTRIPIIGPEEKKLLQELRKNNPLHVLKKDLSSYIQILKNDQEKLLSVAKSNAKKAEEIKKKSWRIRVFSMWDKITRKTNKDKIDLLVKDIIDLNKSIQKEIP